MNKPTNGPSDPTADLLRQALADEGEAIRTDPGALHKIQARTRPTQTASRRGWAWTALGAGAAAAAVITAAVVIGNNDRGTTPTTNSPTDTPTVPTETRVTDAPAVSPFHPGVYDPAGTNVTLYYVYVVPQVVEAGPREGFAYIYAEPHTVPDVSPIGAVREFLTSTPIDPDYVSGWPEGVDVASIEFAGGTTTIALFGSADLSTAPDLVAADVSNEDSAQRQAASYAIQALIRTAGITDGQVAFTYNGERVTRLLGVDVSDEVAVQPEQSQDFSVITRSPIQVTSPVDGQTLSNPITVTGNGNVWEGTVNWRLLDESGGEVDSGFETTAFSEWADFDIRLGTLDPGTYTFQAIFYSPANGDPVVYDDKTFTVA